MISLIDYKYIELAQNNPELFIANYLLNGLLSDSPQWINVGENLSERFPYLSIIYLFNNDNRFDKELFRQKYNDKIANENDSLKTFIKEYSHFYNSDINIYLKKIDELFCTIHEQKKEIYYLKEQIDYLNYSIKKTEEELRKKTELSALLTNIYRNIGNVVAHYFRVRPIYDISVLDDDKFDYSSFCNLISRITSITFDETDIRKQNNVKTLISYIISEINKNDNSEIIFEKYSIIGEQIIEFDRKSIARIVRSFCGKEDISSNDTIEVANLNISGLVNYLKDNFAATVSHEDFAGSILVSDVETHVKRITIGSDMDFVVKRVSKFLSNLVFGDK